MVETVNVNVNGGGKEFKNNDVGGTRNLEERGAPQLRICYVSRQNSCAAPRSTHSLMVNYYDEVEIEDFSWDPVAQLFHYPCPCGDRFEISKAQLRDGEDVAICPSCSLIVRVVYDYVSVMNQEVLI